MSTAQLVPETWELDGDDAMAVLKECKLDRLLVDSVKRFRSADGFTHARSLAFALFLTILPGVIALVGLATFAGVESFRKGVTDLIDQVAPGASGAILTDALSQGTETSRRNGVVPLTFGVIAMAVSGITMFGQIERGSNRLYGIEQDRPGRAKYALAARLGGASLTLVLLLFLVFGTIDSARLVGPTWLRLIIRITFAIALTALCFALIFQRSPHRHQPNVSWLMVGSTVATALWVLSTTGLAVMWQLSSTFGETYGPLAGVMAMSLWCYLTAIGLYLGVACAAQLEAVRAGRPAPQDPSKVARSAPAAGRGRVAHDAG